MLRQGLITSFDWTKYDQSNIVYAPKSMTAEDLRDGYRRVYQDFYSWRSMAQRFPVFGSRPRGLWAIYNMFYRQIEVRGIGTRDMIAAPTPMPSHAAEPPLIPRRSAWRDLVTENHAEHLLSTVPEEQLVPTRRPEALPAP
jgi:hypothetical protein